jgi:Tol biopolymer transport system component
MVDKEGYSIRQLADHPSDDQQPTWSPDVKHIAFVSWFIGKGAKGKGSGIFIINRDGKNMCEVTKDSKLTRSHFISASSLR